MTNPARPHQIILIVFLAIMWIIVATFTMFMYNVDHAAALLYLIFGYTLLVAFICYWGWHKIAHIWAEADKE